VQVKAASFATARDSLRRAGPYLLLELLLPGGTLLALLLWLSSGVPRGQLADVQRLSPVRVAIERVVTVCRCASIAPL
jgi:hypothetical protein